MSLDNIVIRASAGSGKTFQLSNRYLLLALNGVDPDTIFASTFTKKAAGEILYRVLVRLAEAAAQPEKHKELCRALGETPDSLDRERIVAMLAKLVRHLHSLRVSTLDSFFVKIAEAFSFELKLPTGWSIADELINQRFLEEAVRVAFSRLETPDAVNLMHLISKGESARSVNAQALEIARKLIEIYRDAPADAWEKLPRRKELTEDELIALEQDYRAASLPENTQRARDAHTREAGLIENRDWDELIAKGFAKKIVDGDYTYYRKPIDGKLAKTLERILDHVFALKTNELATRTEKTGLLLGHINAAYEEIKFRSKALLFGDVPRSLVAGFADLSKHFTEKSLAHRINAPTRHLLLDEFQDTAPVQWDILREFVHAALAGQCGQNEQSGENSQDREGASGDDSGSFFCVGDVKQAIYGWRGGSADIFKLVETEVSPLKEEQLNVSWRSSPIILDTVNTIFGEIDGNPWLIDKPESPEYEEAAKNWKKVGFQEHRAAKPELPGYVVLETSPLKDTPEADALFAELAQLSRNSADAESGIEAFDGVGDVEAADNDGTDGDDAGGAGLDRKQKIVTIAHAVKRIVALHRRNPERSIGVLTLKNDTIAKIIYGLRRAGIDASEEGGNPLTDSAAVEIVLSAMILADHPGDTIARFHVANSLLAVPLGLRYEFNKTADKTDETGKEDAELQVESPQSTATSRHSSSRVAVPKKSYKDDERARKVAQSIRETLLRDGYGRTVQIWAKLLAPDCDDREMSRLLQLVEEAYLFDSRDDAGLRPSVFAEYIRSKKVHNPRSVPVRVMTIHQSKGLEFDIVVLPELDSDLAGLIGNRPLVVVGRSAPTGPIERIVRYAGLTLQSRLPKEFQRMFRDDRRAKIEESLCKLYVAITRARHELVMIVPGKKTGKKIATRKTLEGVLRGVFSPFSDNDAPNSVIYAYGNPEWFRATGAPQPGKGETGPDAEKSSLSPTLEIELAPIPEQPRRLLHRFTPSAHGDELAIGDTDYATETEIAEPEIDGFTPEFAMEPKSDEIGTRRLRGRDRRHALLYGTAIHACFETVEWIDTHEPDTVELETVVQRVYQAELLEGEAKKESRQTVRDFLAMLKRPAIRNALALDGRDPARVHVLRERPFLIPYEDGLMRGSIDRLVVEYDRDRAVRAEILDYKTDLLRDPAERKARETEYQSQLDDYRKAVMRLYRLEESQVHARLLFVQG